VKIFKQLKGRNKVLISIVPVECMTLLLLIREVPGPDLELETGYHGMFSAFSSDPPDKYRECLELGHDCFLSYIFQLIH
jgi:hypothetical protein